jgi:acetyl esterase/lipase
VKASIAAGVDLDLLTVPDGQHGFDVLDDTPRSREVIARTVAFVTAHLQAPR